MLAHLPIERLRHADRDLELAALAVMIGVDGLSDRIASSFVELDRTLATWPQLAAEVNHGGAVVATAARAILLGHDVPSGRQVADLPHGIGQTYRPPIEPAALPESGARVEDLPDDLREILELAMLSPSGGNSQQWRFVVRARAADVVHLPERSAGHALFDNRGTLHRVVMGTVIESIVVATRARGLSVQVDYDPPGPDDLVYARITICESGPAATPAERVLGDALSTRRSQRALSKGRPLTDEELTALHQAVAGSPASLWISGDETTMKIYGEGIAMGNRLRVLVKEMHKEAFDEFYFRSDDPHRQDGLAIENLQLGYPEQIAFRVLRRPEIAQFLHERGEGSRLLEFGRDWADGASAVGAVTAAGDTRRDIVEAGRAVMRIWLAATAIGVGMHPTTTLLHESEMLDGPEGDVFSSERKEIETRMAEFRRALLRGSDAPLALVFRLVAGPEMPDMKKKTPRRPLACHLKILPADEPTMARED